MRTKIIIALHGDTRCGKDTLADLFVEGDGFIKMAFADPLYDEIAAAFGVTVEQLRSPEWKNAKQKALQPRLSDDKAYIKAADKAGYFSDEHMTSRQVLQTWGTEYRRKEFGEEYWAMKLVNRVNDMRFLVVSDLRENVEYAALLSLVNRGYAVQVVTVEVLRYGTVHTSHSSDRALSRAFIDIQVQNNSTELEMYESAKHQLAQRGITV